MSKTLLEIDGNNYSITSKKRFDAYAELINRDKEICFDFAYDMTYGGKGRHRDSRSGGDIHRSKGSIFINTFQGKMAEYALYRYLEAHNIPLEEPDITESDLGEWDSYDLEVQNKHLSVKSTKAKGNLLLLETKDWNENGEYIPNLRNNRRASYDYTVVVRLHPNGEELMKQNKLYYQTKQEIPDNIREILIEKIYNQEWKYDFPGFIYLDELKAMIREKHVLPKNAYLNGTTRMDAENYYYQVGDMHPLEELFTPRIKDNKIVSNSKLLKRICPRCGQNLVVRKGPYGFFWGCEGYATNGCRFQEKYKMI